MNQLLSLDLSLLEKARGIISPEYAQLVQITGELVVVYGALLLVGLWIFGVYKKSDDYKKKALAIFFTIICVFTVYAIINLGIPQWRPGATEAVKGIVPLIPHPIDNSFPSGHALFTGALVYGILRYLHTNWFIILTLIIGCLTLMARVIGGVHYPGDIIGGLVFGIMGAYFLRSIIDSIVLRTAPILIRIARWIKL